MNYHFHSRKNKWEISLGKEDGDGKDFSISAPPCRHSKLGSYGIDTRTMHSFSAALNSKKQYIFSILLNQMFEISVLKAYNASS